MTTKIDIRPQDLDILRRILKAALPHHAKVFVFGSRANGRARRASDLDLAIDAGRPLTLAETSALAEAFETSDLPYAVDIVDAQSIGERFRALVERDSVPLILV